MDKVQKLVAVGRQTLELDHQDMAEGDHQLSECVQDNLKQLCKKEAELSSNLTRVSDLEVHESILVLNQSWYLADSVSGCVYVCSYMCVCVCVCVCTCTLLTCM